MPRAVLIDERDRALTMIELLVCLGVLAIALGSVLSVFVAGTRFAAKSRRRMDASRVARAVHDRFQKGWEEPPSGSDNWHGHDDDGDVVDETIQSDQMPSISDVPASWAPAYVIDSPVRLVWRCQVLTPNPYTFDVPGMHLLVTTVSHDSNEDACFDTEPDDEVIGTYCAILVDR